MKKKLDEDMMAAQSGGVALGPVPRIRISKILIPMILAALCFIALVFLFTSILPLTQIAENVGKTTGENTGQIVGWAVGSVEGAIDGVPVGYQDGKAAGLNADDTVAEIANKIEQNVCGLGQLDVLAANVDLTTYHEVGKKYGALYLLRGSAVFSIDLSKAKITYNDRDGIISIVLPQPGVEVKIDPSETKRIAEWERKYFNGTDSEGAQAYLNSFGAFSSKSVDTIENYQDLLSLASESAKEQVKAFADAARGNTNILVTVSMDSD